MEGLLSTGPTPSSLKGYQEKEREKWEEFHYLDTLNYKLWPVADGFGHHLQHSWFRSLGNLK